MSCLMRLVVVLAMLLATLVGSISAQTQLSYAKGQEFVYSMNAMVDARGADASSLIPNSGSFSTMNATVVVQCTDINADGSFLFVMNMFNTMVGVGQSAGPNALEAVQIETYALGDGNTPLGYDMYFQQSPDGEITQIWYNTADDPYYINVKIGAINAFQTRVVAANQPSQLIQESDPVGVHTSAYASAANNGLHIQKTFTQENFVSFSTDPQLTPQNVKLNAQSSAGVHPQGYIQSASVSQSVLLINPSNSAAAAKQSVEKDGQPNGFEMYMLSRGQLNIALQSVSSSSSSNNNNANNANQQSRLRSSQRFTFQTISDPQSNMVADTLAGRAAKSADVARLTPPNIDADEAMAEVMNPDTPAARAFKLMTKLVRLFKIQIQQGNHETVQALLEKYLSSAGSVVKSVQLSNRAFYIAASISHPSMERIIIKYGIRSTDASTRLRAVFAAASFEEPTEFIAESLMELYTGDKDRAIADSALLAFGAILRKTKDSELQRNGGKLLASMLATAVSADNDAVDTVVTLLSAVTNAGPDVVSIKDIPPAVFSQAALANAQVYRTTVGLLKAYIASNKPSVAQTASKILMDLQQQHADGDVKFYPSVVAGASEFPFNKSFTKEVTFGGSTINVQLAGELFAGTNLNCNNQYFNYEGLAQATGTFSMFNDPLELFNAEAIYGKQDGQSLADSISVVVLGQTLYNQPIPQLDCNEHTYQIYHSQPALSKSYVVWISVIPVVFQASAALDLTVDWGWQICDSQLSAMIEIVPGAGLTVSGDVNIDLLIIKAGIDISASLNSDVHPQAYIHGTQCAVGFDIEQTNTPMSAQFESYYQTQKCKFLIFDCKWQPQNEHTWWSWSMPSSTNVLFNQQWAIAA